VNLIILFETLNGDSDVTAVMNWVNRQLDRLVPVLKAAITASDAKALSGVDPVWRTHFHLRRRRHRCRESPTLCAGIPATDG
jgi:hypothetical protein